MLTFEAMNSILGFFNKESPEYRFLIYLFTTGAYPKTEDNKFPNWLNFGIIQNIKIKVDTESRTNGFNHEWAYALFDMIEGKNNWFDYQNIPNAS